MKTMDLWINQTRTALRSASVRDALDFLLPVGLSCLAFAGAAAYLTRIAY